MAFGVRETGCCGVLELVDISTRNSAEDVIRAAAPLIKDLKPYQDIPYIYFTGVVQRRIRDHASGRTDDYGTALADYIEANNLGTVIRSLEPQYNWTGNSLKMWIWLPNWTILRRL